MLLLLLAHAPQALRAAKSRPLFAVLSLIAAFFFLGVISLAVLCLIALLSLFFSEFISLPCSQVSVAGKLQQFVGILNSIYMHLEGSGALYPIAIIKV